MTIKISLVVLLVALVVIAIWFFCSDRDKVGQTWRAKINGNITLKIVGKVKQNGFHLDRCAYFENGKPFGVTNLEITYECLTNQFFLVSMGQ
jgi:hypothetical protein